MTIYKKKHWYGKSNFPWWNMDEQKHIKGKGMDWRDGKSNTQFTIGVRKKIKFLPRWKCLIKVGLITSSDISIKTNQQLPRGDEFGSLRRLVLKCFGSCHHSWKHNNYGQRTLPFTCERQSAKTSSSRKCEMIDWRKNKFISHPVDVKTRSCMTLQNPKSRDIKPMKSTAQRLYKVLKSYVFHRITASMMQ